MKMPLQFFSFSAAAGTFQWRSLKGLFHWFSSWVATSPLRIPSHITQDCPRQLVRNRGNLLRYKAAMRCPLLFSFIWTTLDIKCWTMGLAEKSYISRLRKWGFYRTDHAVWATQNLNAHWPKNSGAELVPSQQIDARIVQEELVCWLCRAL